MTSLEILVEIFSFFDRKFLETVLRLTSRRLYAIVDRHFVNQPPYISVSGVNIAFEKQTVCLKACRLNHQVVEKFGDIGLKVQRGATGACGLIAPRYLRLPNHLYWGKLYSEDCELVVSLIETFQHTWKDSKSAFHFFCFPSEGRRLLSSILNVISVAQLKFTFTVPAVGRRALSYSSLFDFPSVRDCATLCVYYDSGKLPDHEYFTPNYIQHFGGHKLEAVRIAEWLHSTPRIDHEIEGCQRDLHIVLEDKISLPFVEPLLHILLETFKTDLIQRGYWLTIQLNTHGFGIAEWRNERTTERLCVLQNLMFFCITRVPIHQYCCEWHTPELL